MIDKFMYYNEKPYNMWNDIVRTLKINDNLPI